MSDEMTALEQEVDYCEEQRSKFVILKRALDAELAQIKPASRVSFNVWRAEKIKQIADCEKSIAHYKQRRQKATDKLYHLKSFEKKKERQGLLDEQHWQEIEELNQTISRLRIENRDLTSRLLKEEERCRRLDRQLDAAIRQLNAIPKQLREPS